VSSRGIVLKFDGVDELRGVEEFGKCRTLTSEGGLSMEIT